MVLKHKEHDIVSASEAGTNLVLSLQENEVLKDNIICASAGYVVTHLIVYVKQGVDISEVDKIPTYYDGLPVLVRYTTEQ